MICCRAIGCIGQLFGSYQRVKERVITRIVPGENNLKVGCWLGKVKEYGGG